MSLNLLLIIDIHINLRLILCNDNHMQGISKHLLVLEQKLTVDTSIYPTVTLGLKRTGNYHFDKPSKQTVTRGFTNSGSEV